MRRGIGNLQGFRRRCSVLVRGRPGKRGRFLWIDAPDANGWTDLDFNRAYNPHCVFTDYATCPLAPRPIRLPFAIEAGEKTSSVAAR
jgi:uncharacterized protein (DUF1684 family)